MAAKGAMSCLFVNARYLARGTMQVNRAEIRCKRGWQPPFRQLSTARGPQARL